MTMCENCWIEEGSPKIYNERISRVVECVRRVYAIHGAGGSLHAVLDDWNLSDGDIDWCEKYAIEAHDGYDPAYEVDRYEAETDCIAALRAISEEERYAALAFDAGLFTAEAADAI